MQSPLLIAALQDRLAAGLYHSNYTYEDLLFIQVCSDPTPVHCNTVLCKMQSPLLGAAVQDRLAAGLYHSSKNMKICSSYRCAVTQQQCTATLFRAKCSLHCLVLLCKTGLQQACITAITPMKICSSYRCAVTQHQCTATLFRAKCSPHCSVLLCKTGLQQACITAITPMKICSSYRCAVTQNQCNPLLFLQNAVPTAWCCCARQACSRLVSQQ